MKKKNNWRYHHFTYICVPKNMIRWCMVPEIWCATDGQKKWHIEVGALPKNWRIQASLAILWIHTDFIIINNASSSRGWRGCYVVETHIKGIPKKPRWTLLLFLNWREKKSNWEKYLCVCIKLINHFDNSQKIIQGYLH